MCSAIDPSLYKFVDSLPFLNDKIIMDSGIKNDKCLPDNLTLKIFDNGDNTVDKALKSACWAYNKMNCLKSEYALGAYVCVAYNLVAKDDGNSISAESNFELNDSLIDTVTQLITEFSLKKALLILISAKINFWNTGSHMVKLNQKGYAENIAKSFYELNTENENEITDLFNVTGAWASTIKILKLFQISELKQVHDYNNISLDYFELNLESNSFTLPTTCIAKLFLHFPAGTSKHSQAYDICKLLANHPTIDL